MGCDIHLYAEQRQADGSWTHLEPEPVEHVIDHGDGKEPYRYTTRSWYGGRDYRLFAMLADVRNGVGFAGIDTGDRLEPISLPRGVPADANPTYRRIAGPYVPCGQPCPGYTLDPRWGSCDAEHGWGEDGHSHTWYTLRELMQVPWDTNMITQRGVVSPAEFLEYVERGKPSSWSGGVSGGGVVHVTPFEMAELLKSGKADPAQYLGSSGTSYYTKVQWTQTWRQSLSWHNEKTGETESEWFDCLDALAKHTVDDGSDIRLLMFFDN